MTTWPSNTVPCRIAIAVPAITARLFAGLIEAPTCPLARETLTSGDLWPAE
jgi:hypothetical protein